MLKILVAPLDWGLGHATRCIPIIKQLLGRGHKVIVAASGAQKAILQEEFPALLFVEIPGYRIKYTKNRAFTIMKIIWNIPKILIRIKAENRWLQAFLRQMPVDVVVSDNRYGLYAKGMECIFMTHQLAIGTGLGRLADNLLRRINYAFLERFTTCWVPDIAGTDSLAGALSHPTGLPDVPVKYIGWLSRFEPARGTAASDLPPGPEPTPNPDLLILLSGPEPQRTILEQLVVDQLSDLGPAKVTLVRGLPGPGVPSAEVSTTAQTPAGLQVHQHLPTADLSRLIASSKVVLSRPGYSTVMDLARLGKRAVFIPTPGQTEQEYLGQYLAGKSWTVCREQRRFSLREAFAAATKLKAAAWPEWHPELLDREIAELTGQSVPDFG